MNSNSIPRVNSNELIRESHLIRSSPSSVIDVDVNVDVDVDVDVDDDDDNDDYDDDDDDDDDDKDDGYDNDDGVDDDFGDDNDINDDNDDDENNNYYYHNYSNDISGSNISCDDSSYDVLRHNLEYCPHVFDLFNSSSSNVLIQTWMKPLARHFDTKTYPANVIEYCNSF